jgi:hypothetical protein
LIALRVQQHRARNLAALGFTESDNVDFDPDTVRGMLAKWESKGKMEKLPPGTPSAVAAVVNAISPPSKFTSGKGEGLIALLDLKT